MSERVRGGGSEGGEGWSERGREAEGGRKRGREVGKGSRERRNE